MATFPSISPKYGASSRSNPTLKQVQFGDGYVHVLKYGLNQNPKTWNLRWEVSETEATTIEDFLDARADDGNTFDWTPLDSSVSYKWRCLSWSKSIPYKDRASISATFTQFFEP